MPIKAGGLTISSKTLKKFRGFYNWLNATCFTSSYNHTSTPRFPTNYPQMRYLCHKAMYQGLALKHQTTDLYSNYRASKSCQLQATFKTDPINIRFVGCHNIVHIHITDDKLNRKREGDPRSPCPGTEWRSHWLFSTFKVLLITRNAPSTNSFIPQKYG